MATRKRKKQKKARRISAQQRVLVKERKVNEAVPLKDIEEGFQALAEYITAYGWGDEDFTKNASCNSNQLN